MPLPRDITLRTVSLPTLVWLLILAKRSATTRARNMHYHGSLVFLGFEAETRNPFACRPHLLAETKLHEQMHGTVEVHLNNTVWLSLRGEL